MKNIVTSKDCLSCRTCCKFKADELYFSPILTKKELSQIEKNTDIPFEYKTHKNSKTVFQLKMIPSKKENGVFVCPFYDEETTYCKVYGVRPLDCQLFPFILVKEKGEVKLAIVNKSECLGLKRQTNEELEKSINNFVKKLKKSSVFQSALKHPELTWDFEKDWMNLI